MTTTPRPTDDQGVAHDLDLTIAARVFIRVGKAATDPDIPSASRAAREIVHHAMLTMWCALCGLDPDDAQARRLGVKMLLAHAEQRTYADIVPAK